MVVKEASKICPICNEANNNAGGCLGNDFWFEFGHNYHLSCLKKLEKQGKPFHENYSKQKRLSTNQVIEVLNLLNDNAFLEYWLMVCCSEKEKETLYSHPILWTPENKEGLDLFP